MRLTPKPWLRRRWPVLVVAPLLAVGTAAVLQGPATESATTVVRVSAGESDAGPGSANEAATLAETYARLLLEDEGLATYVGDRTAQSASEVRDGLSTLQVPGTSILEVTFTSTDGAIAGYASEVIAEALTSEESISDAVTPGVLRLVRSDSSSTTSSKSSGNIATAVVVGLLLGAGIAWGAERFDPRVDNRRDAVALLPCPVVDLLQASPAAYQDLLRRWETQTSPVVLVPLAAATRQRTCQIAEELRELSRQDGVAVEFAVRGLPGESDATTDPEGAPETQHDGAGLIVGVLDGGSRRSSVSAALGTLEDFGLSIQWALLVRRGRSDPRSRPAWMTAAGLKGHVKAASGALHRAEPSAVDHLDTSLRRYSRTQRDQDRSGNDPRIAQRSRS